MSQKICDTLANLEWAIVIFSSLPCKSLWYCCRKQASLQSQKLFTEEMYSVVLTITKQ